MNRSFLLTKSLNQAFAQKLIPFSTCVLKPSAPYILLIEDHSRHISDSVLQTHGISAEKIEQVIRCCYLEYEYTNNIIEFEDVHISRAPLYSSYHYLVTFI